jgi:hypothetical protein
MLKSLILFIILFLSAAQSQAQKYDWVNGIDGFFNYSSAVDKEQNVVCVGSFESSISVGNEVYVASGAGDLLVVKFDRNGQVLWSFATGGTCRESATSVVIDSSLNITVGGESFRSSVGQTLKIGNYNLTPQNNNAFLFRLSKDGDLRWVTAPNSPSSTMDYGLKTMAADTAGCIIFTGNFSTSLQLGEFTLTSNFPTKYIAKLSPIGQVLWVKRFSESFACYPIELTTDRHNNLYLGCELRASWSFDDSVFVHRGEYDIVILQLTPSGDLIKSWHFGQAGRESVDGIGVDNSDNIYIAGNYWSNLQIGEISFPSVSNYAARFLMRLDASGEIKWGKPIAFNTYYLGGLCVDRFGNTSICFNYKDSLNIIDRTIPGLGSWDVVFASYDDQGNRKWYMHAGDEKWDTSWSLSADVFGHVYFTGRFYEKSKFGTIALQSSTPWACFVGRISEPIILTTSPSQMEYCPGDSIRISFSTNISHPFGNQFFAFLSDSSGKFDSVNLIGKINGRRDSFMVAIIPAVTKPSDRYRVRVSSTLPSQEGLDRGPYFTVHPKPAVEIEARKSVEFCEGNKVPLVASGGASYTWSTGETTASVEIGTSGWHYVTAHSEFGCDATDSIKLTSHPYPVASVSVAGPTSFCQGGQVVLTAKGGSSYLWSNGEKTASITVKASGEYSVTVKGGGDCTDESEKISVTVHPLPAKPSITEVDGHLRSSSPAGNHWYLAGGTMLDTNRQFKPTKSGKYYVRVTDSNGCMSQSEFFDFEAKTDVVRTEATLTFEVNPNPAKDHVHVRIDSKYPATLEIVGILGLVVAKYSTLSTEVQEISLSELSAGAYYIRLSTNGVVTTKKLQISR